MRTEFFRKIVMCGKPNLQERTILRIDSYSDDHLLNYENYNPQRVAWLRDDANKIRSRLGLTKEQCREFI